MEQAEIFHELDIEEKEIVDESPQPDHAIKYDWFEFGNYAVKNGISLSRVDDWEPWWECWKAGYDHCHETLSKRCLSGR